MYDKNKVAKIRKETLDDLKSKLNKYGKCAVIRCTGFGKTVMASQLMTSYKRVLYLYPAKIIKDTAEKAMYKYLEDENLKEGDTFVSYDGDIQVGSNVEFMTYMKLVRIKDMSLYEGYDLIIVDECHMVGAEKTSVFLHNLLAQNPNAHFVGLSATIVRQDDFDVLGEFFDNVEVYKYTLADAIKDGIIQKPYYCYSTYDIENSLKESALFTEVRLSDTDCKRILKSKYIQLAKLIGAEHQIKKVCDKYASSTDYMKFIVFFWTEELMIDKYKDVVSWFKSAYPDKDVVVTEVHSKTPEAKDIGRLNDLKPVSGRIDLIVCINMLNQGYHVDDLTGIVMMRGTYSNIVYSQQLGRALSTGDSEPKIVFDFVDNIHRKSNYSILDRKSFNDLFKKLEMLKKELDSLRKSGKATKEEIKSKRVEYMEYKDFVDNTVHNYMKYESVDNLKGTKLIENDFIGPELLTPVGCMATSREILAKVVAETISERARRAFKKWVDCKALREGKSVDTSSLEVMYQFIEENGITEEYILGIEDCLGARDANLVDIPLSPFCDLETVSINAVLNLMFKHGYTDAGLSEYREII